MKDINKCCSVSFVLVIALILSCLSPMLSVYADTQTVKVGWYTEPGIQYIDDSGKRCGFSYDYYAQIARYEDVQFSYVSGSWEDCYEMLKAGNIDVLSFVEKTPESEEYFDFSDMPIAHEYLLLSSLADNSNISPNDYNTLKGSRVAVTDSSVHTEIFSKFMEDNQLTGSLITYKNTADSVKALQNGEVDLLLRTSYFQPFENEKVIAKLQGADLYFAVRKGDSELLDKINSALDALNTYNPYFKDYLGNRYFPKDHSDIIQLSKLERDYLAEIKNITVVIPSPRGYLANYSDGEFSGINIDILNYISDKLGVTFNYIAMDDYSKFDEIGSKQRHVLYCGFYYDWEWASSQQVSLSSPYLTLPFNMVYNGKKALPSDSEIKIAAAKVMHSNDTYILQNYPASSITYFDTLDECFDAVAKGKCDALFCDTYTSSYYLKYNQYNMLEQKPIPFSHEICFAVPETYNSGLLTILAKTINTIDPGVIDNIIFTNTYNNTDRADFLGDYSVVNKIFIGMSILIVSLFVIAVVFAVISIIRSRKIALIQYSRSVKTEFMKYTSHELAALFHDVRGVFDMIMNNSDQADNSYFDDIGQSLEKIHTVINSINNVTQLSVGGYSLYSNALQKGELAEYIAANVAPLAEENQVKLSACFSPLHYKYIYTDSEQLKDIVGKILTYAINHTRPCNTVKYSVVLKRLTANNLKFIFATSYTDFEFVKNDLKLEPINKLISLLGGRMDIVHSYGKNSKISFSIIVRGADRKIDEIENIRKNISVAPVSGEQLKNINMRGKCALVIENDEIDMNIMDRRLDNVGFDVEKCYSGEDALIKIRSSAENYYDIVFISLDMTDKDGRRIAAEIRKMHRMDTKDLPLVAISSEVQADEIQGCIDAGINHTLTKPFSAEDLYAVLINLLE